MFFQAFYCTQLLLKFVAGKPIQGVLFRELHFKYLTAGDLYQAGHCMGLTERVSCGTLCMDITAGNMLQVYCSQYTKI
jgi:hypothetical protein